MASEVRLTLETGLLKITKNGKARFMSHSDPFTPLIVELEFGEQILTGKNTRATIKMRGNEEEIRLRVDTLFKVNSLDPNRTEVDMPTGKARFKIKRKLKRKKKGRRQFNGRTVAAIVGVRGTEFVMGTSGASTSLLTLDGSVEMAAAAAPHTPAPVGRWRRTAWRRSGSGIKGYLRYILAMSMYVDSLNGQEPPPGEPTPNQIGL